MGSKEREREGWEREAIDTVYAKRYYTTKQKGPAWREKSLPALGQD